MMAREVREEEIYEDLSMILQLVKKKLTLVIRHPYYEQRLQNQEQQQSDNLLVGFRTKYEHVTHVSPIITKVIERFFCRIKEIISQLYLKISRQRLELIRFFKETQQFIGKPLNYYNPLRIASFLNAAILLGSSKEAGKQIPVVKQKEKRYQQITDAKEIHPRLCHQPEGQKRMSEVQLMQRNAEHYRVMDIDAEHIRGRYFDLKSGQKANILNDILFRNRFIKQIMKDYQLQYERFRRKQPINGTKRIFCRFRRRQERWELLQSLCHSQNRIETIDSTNLNKNSRAKYEADRKRRDLNASSNMMERRNRQNKMTIDSFRSLYEQKLSQKKQNIKIRNMVINLQGSEGGLKDKGLNEKRMQFYKKSQDQVRLRYKYYNYSYKSANTSKSSIKYRTINAESTFNTIDA